MLKKVLKDKDKLEIFNMKKIINNLDEVYKILEKIQESLGDNKTILIIDEVWKYAKSEKLLSEIFNMYKTIRKRNASIVTITQDVLDFFEYQNGRYAKSILNNSSFKLFFKSEYKELKQHFNITDKVNYLKKGEAILSVGENNLKVIIQANEFESEILNVNDNSNNR